MILYHVTGSCKGPIFDVINSGSHEEAKRKSLVTWKLFASWFVLGCRACTSSTALFILFLGELKGVKIGSVSAVQF